MSDIGEDNGAREQLLQTDPRFNGQTGQGMQGQGSGQIPDEGTVTQNQVNATESNKDRNNESSADGSYEPPTQQFEKIQKIESAVVVSNSRTP